MAVFVSSAVYLEPGYRGNHPLAIARLKPVIGLVEALGWLDRNDPRQYAECPPASLTEITDFHDPDYVAALLAAQARGRASDDDRARYRLGTMENPIFPGLFDRAARSVGGSILAADKALETGLAFHAGGGTHHGMRAHANGFCYFNDPVFAIRRLLARGLSRVLYVDLDAHHGDGVEAAFADDARVTLISAHEANRWPYSGLAADRGCGNVHNLPLPRATTEPEFRRVLDHAILPLARAARPQAVVITVGADALAGDPLSSLRLGNTALWDASVALAALSPATVVLGGGGYNPWTLGRAWAGLWGRLTNRDIPATLDPKAQAALDGLDCDLVEEEDRDPRWFTTIADPVEHAGPIRPEIDRLIAAARAPIEGETHVMA